jgi:hypothetical protein
MIDVVNLDFLYREGLEEIRRTISRPGSGG